MRVHLPAIKLITKMGKLMANVKSSKKPLTVLVEGNIGSGKTTFLNYFQRNPNVCVLAEPVEMWRSCDGINLFGLLYSNPQKWSFTFQSYVLLTMLGQHQFKTDRPIKMLERSLYSARYCFIDNMYREGIIPAPSAEVLNEKFKWFIENVDIGVDLIIYLRTSPEIVHQRMLQRNREEERKVPLEYLKSLHQAHEDWLYHKTAFTCPAPVLTLDANLDKVQIMQEYRKSEKHIQQLSFAISV